MWDTVRTAIRPGDLVHLAHNDKTTDGAAYRADLETRVAGVRAQGGEPVLLTPVVRHWFNADGPLDHDTALLAEGPGVDPPTVVRSVAPAARVPLIDLTARTGEPVESLGAEGSRALHPYDGRRGGTPPRSTAPPGSRPWSATHSSAGTRCPRTGSGGEETPGTFRPEPERPRFPTSAHEHLHTSAGAEVFRG
ncbi:hypothetical protein [Streptomyces prasinopilosus]|uniref:hypothetical protein n=1 Tax=Streptomyces prasinopilosus TaxID=67344 RepID=UPI0006EB73F2